MGPVHSPELPAGGRCRCRPDQDRPADLGVAGRSHASDDQLAAVVVDEIAVAVADHERRRIASPLARHGLGLPDTLAGGEAQASELSVAADPIDVVSFDHRGVHQGVQAVRFDATVAAPLP